MYSMRRRLVLTLLGGLLLGGVIGAWGIYQQSNEELGELFDDRLRAIAENLPPGAVLPSTHLRESASREEDDEDDEDDIVVQLWDANGKLLGAQPAGAGPSQRGPAGLNTLRASNEDWRSFTLAHKDGGWLQVSQSISARKAMAAQSAAHLLMPFLLLLPLLGGFTAWAVAIQLRPLLRLAETLRNRKSLFNQQLQIEAASSELLPVVDAVNDLLHRQAQAAAQQQAFLADAAHALRTPLTVLSLQLDRARQMGSESERASAFDALRAGLDRATRLVDQLLALARSDPGLPMQLSRGPVALNALISHCMAELYPLASRKFVDLGLVRADAINIEADATGLRHLIVNLLDNAIRHTPEHGQIDVSLERQGSAAIFTVSDSGPGVSADQRLQLFGRFVRDGKADSGGSGLGLAIARQVAEQHGGRITLNEAKAGRGLSVRVELPLA